jgi:hypothetical protein
MMETTDDDLITNKIYRYKCIRCNLIFSEIDLLKDHYFDKHINTSGLTTTTTTTNNKKLVNNKRKTRKSNLSTSLPIATAAENDDEYNNEIENKNKSTSFRTNSEITIKRRKTEQPVKEEEEKLSDIDKRLSELNEEEMKKFNLEDIDETELIKEIGDGVYNKKRELLAGRITWAEWRNFMWPAKIVKVTSRSITSSSQSSLKIHIRFYERNPKLGKSIFKMDASKVELFFKCKEHEHYKVLGAINPSQRKEFYITYTNALKDYIELVKEASTMPQIVKEEEEEIKEEIEKKYLILGKQYTIEEIQDLASKPYSNEQMEENKSREETSKNLFDLVMSEECKVSQLKSLNKIEREREREKVKFFILRII